MKVLVADDCSTTLEILRLSLRKWGFDPMLVSDGEQALRILKSPAGPRLALLDWDMPIVDGVTVCQQLRDRHESAMNYVYTIVLTARDGEENLLRALEAGADDYLIKPVGTRELQLRVRAGKRILEFQDRVVASNRKLAGITTHDQLTNRLNRQSLLERLTTEIERSARNSGHCSYVTIEIDKFDEIRSEYGMKVGDAILKWAAAKFRTTIRSYDSLGRIGAHLFAIVLPESQLGMGAGMAERLRVSIENEPFEVDEDTHVPITVSIGVSSSSAEGMDRKQILAGSERSQQHAKAMGGNRVMMWEAGIVLDPINAVSSSVSNDKVNDLLEATETLAEEVAEQMDSIQAESRYSPTS